MIFRIQGEGKKKKKSLKVKDFVKLCHFKNKDEALN